jgi:signal transduction histidine kinase
MQNILLDYYFTLLEVTVMLLLMGGVGIALLWAMQISWRNRLKGLEQKHADDLAKHNSEYLRTLHNHLQSAIAHEFGKGLDYISNKSAQTLEGLGEKPNALQDKQKAIISKACDLAQHAKNMLYVFAPGQDEPEMALLSIRQLVEYVLLEHYTYADSEGIILRSNLEDVEPTILDRDLTLLAINNVAHNAIKYSFFGGVVETTLSLTVGVLEGAEKAICIDVKDTGRGISEQDQDKVFELSVRGDSLIEPGSGLGLYCAREAARRQGGDVILVRSSLNQGSVFRIILPYTDVDFDR